MAAARGPLPSIVAAAAGLALGAGAGALVVVLVAGAGASAASPAPSVRPAERLVDLLLTEADAAAIPPGSWTLAESSTTTLGALLDRGIEFEPAGCAEYSLPLLPAAASTPVATAVARGVLADGGSDVQHRLEWFPDAETAAAAFGGLEALFAECAELVVTDPAQRWPEVSRFGLVAVDPGGDGRLPTVEIERGGDHWGERIVFQLSGNVVSSLTLPSPLNGWVAQLQYDHLRDRVDELLRTPLAES